MILKPCSQCQGTEYRTYSDHPDTFDARLRAYWIVCTNCTHGYDHGLRTARTSITEAQIAWNEFNTKD